LHIGIIVAILERLKKGHKWNGQETIYDLTRISVHEDNKALLRRSIKGLFIFVP